MADVRFHPEAQAEYQAALAWYLARSHRAADRFEAEAEHVLGLVAANPAMFPRYDDEHRFALLRRFPFSVVYRFVPEDVYVIALPIRGESRAIGRHATELAPWRIHPGATICLDGRDQPWVARVASSQAMRSRA